MIGPVLARPGAPALSKLEDAVPLTASTLGAAECAARAKRHERRACRKQRILAAVASLDSARTVKPRRRRCAAALRLAAPASFGVPSIPFVVCLCIGAGRADLVDACNGAEHPTTESSYSEYPADGLARVLNAHTGTWRT
jgi:hypothetical protein